MFIKKLKEKREELRAEMDALVDTAETEERAMSDEEGNEFDEKEKEIKKIDRTIAAYEKRAVETQMEDEPGGDKGKTDKEKEEAEYRAFDEYIRGTYTEERAETNLDFGTNGAVIPASIANKIIEKVKDVSPIFTLADTYNVGGNLTIPKYDETTQKITMAYADEFTELTSSSGKFASIELKGYLAAALTKVSKKLINNSGFDIVSYVITKMAEAIVEWTEGEMLNGTDEKIEGISKCTQVVTTEGVGVVTSDDLIDLQEEVPDRYQGDCIWVMNRKTRKQIRKLKDADGNYLLNKDLTSKWGYTLLGTDVYCSDNMPEIATGKKAVCYGDFSGLAMKLSETPEIEVLREKFATQHAVGVIAWMEMDCKIEDEQKIAVLNVK